MVSSGVLSGRVMMRPTESPFGIHSRAKASSPAIVAIVSTFPFVLVLIASRGPAIVLSHIDTCSHEATVTVAEPDTPSVVAVIEADPSATAVTNPDALTAATFASDDDHAKVFPSRV
jgi:hypothetical protein